MRKLVKVNKEDKFGNLIVIKELKLYIHQNGNKIRRILCECQCKEKNRIIVNLYQLTSGSIISCGCKNIKFTGIVTKSIFKNRIKEIHGSKFKILHFTGAKDKCRVLCSIHNIKFHVASAGQLYTKGAPHCPKCRKESFLRKKNETFLKKHLQILKNNHPTVKFIGPYVSSKKKTQYLCIKHDLKFKTLPEYLNYTKNSNCPKCKKIIHKKRGKRIKQDNSKIFYKEFKKYYGKKYKLIGKYVDTWTPVRIECYTHGETTFIPNKSFYMKTPCSQCNIEKRDNNNRRKTQKKFEKEVQNHNSNIKILSKYKSARDYVQAKCKDCKHKWNVWADSLVRGVGCPVCNATIGNIKGKSSGEKSLFKFIKKYFPDAVSSNRKEIYPQELDIYIPSKNFAIEFNGLYWHSDLYKDRNYHMDKFKACLKKGIKLISIYEDDWYNKRKVVKRTIKHILGISKTRTYARKLKLKIYPKLTEKLKLFYTRNHIQSFPYYGGITLTLKKEKDIYAAMTFSSIKSIRGTIKRKNEWELTRFACKGAVVGAASRLFINFIRNFKVKKILSYSDNDLFDGKLYGVLGFKNIANVKPDYKVVFPNSFSRKHKSHSKRKNLEKILGSKFNPNLSEKENCWNNILRIFDSGKKKWVYSKKVT